MSNKIIDQHENPVDLYLLKIVDVLNPVLYATHHTPNQITTYSFLCGLASVYCLYRHNLPGFVVFLFFSYFFDCVDGSFARKYKMVSRFGDIYDHITDALVLLMFAVLIYTRYRTLISKWTFFIFLLLVALMCCHLGCQQKNCVAESCVDGESLNCLKLLCRNPEWIRVTKFFGTGTFFVFLAGVCILYERKLRVP